MAFGMALQSTSGMAPRPRKPALPPSRPRFRPTYIRQWREHRGLNQEQLASRLDMTQSQVSQLENGRRGYTQETLEAIADALQTDVASLLMRDPTDPEAIWSIWDNAKPGERRMIVDIAKTVTKTGT
jgi:transcriptional regulator with XRE-family HTH domain